MTWQPIVAACIGFVGFAGRDVLSAIARSDWLFWRIVEADLRAIGRAQRRKAK